MKTPRDARVLAVLLASITLICALPLVLTGAVPTWWQSEKVLREQNNSALPALDYAVGNQGQLKHFALAAYQHLLKTLPESTGGLTKNPDGTLSHRAIALMKMISKWVDIDYNFETNVG